MTETRTDSAGIVFAQSDSGQRSTAAAGRAIFAAALAPVDPQAAAAVRAERNWRGNYVSHVRGIVETSLRSPDAALAISRAGLAALAASMRFVRDGTESTLAQAMAALRAQRLCTATIRGTHDAAPAPLAIPYRGALLTGAALLHQLDDWRSRGIVETSFVESLRRVHDHPDWLDLSDLHFALLGANAEIGPFEWLIRHRANVVAIDQPQPAIWQRLLTAARGGNGTLHVPVRDAASAQDSDGDLAQHAGADLLAEAPEIAAWLGEFDAPLTIGAYAYLDGARHVQVAAAMDAVQSTVAARRPGTSLALLATPTDIYAVPADAARDAHARYAQRSWRARLWQQTLHGASGGRLFARNIALPKDGGASFGIADCLVQQQGPNYALAKRLQQWRALADRADGRHVSMHVAPPSLTWSVTKNRLMAAAYGGAHVFGVEVFEPATTRALMAALLVHDLRHPQAAANPVTPLAHPLALLTEAANHGGLWRMPFTARSALPFAVLLGAVRPK